MSGGGGTEKTFHLTTEYVREKISEEGEVFLPYNKGFTKIVVDVEENLAEEIKTLNLLGNPVTEIEGAEKLARVKKIYCNNCGLNSVPRWIEKLPAVEIVILWGNDIDSIPEWITQMETLRTLDVGHNRSNWEMMMMMKMMMMMMMMMMLQIGPRLEP